MKIVRVLHKTIPVWGVIEGQWVYLAKGSPFSGRFDKSAHKVPARSARLLVPAAPTKIVLAGLNYADHARELRMKLPDEPVIFLKPPSSLIGPRDVIRYPSQTAQLDYEAELALVVKKEARNVSEKYAADHILGYTCLNDVTARDLQKKDTQWTRAKSFDTFCPLGPCIETDLDLSDARIRLFLNGVCKQDSTTAQFIFHPFRLFSFISHIMTLYPGDVISTGTPPGVGPMKPGDTVAVNIEGIGELQNRLESGR